MEPHVDRYTFRLQLRKQTGEYDARVIERDGAFSLQVWMSTPEQPDILLEVKPVRDGEKIWPLFRALCVHRGVVPLERRRRDGALGPWEPIP